METPYRSIDAGTRFTLDNSVWRKRQDGDAELIGRDGSVSFIGGSRCIVPVDPEEIVSPIETTASITDSEMSEMIEKWEIGDARRLLRDMLSAGI